MWHSFWQYTDIFFLEIMINLEKQMSNLKMAPIHKAAQHNSKKMLELLIDSGVDINAKDE